MAKDKTDDAATGLLKIHSRRELARDGRPRMTRKMLRLIGGAVGGAEEDDPDAGAGADGECDELADLDQERKAAALARLQEEYPRLYGIVYLTDYRALSLRAIGRCLGLDHHTVKKHRGQAVALMRACVRTSVKRANLDQPSLCRRRAHTGEIARLHPLQNIGSLARNLGGEIRGGCAAPRVRNCDVITVRRGVVINSQATRENVARAAYEAAFSGAIP